MATKTKGNKAETHPPESNGEKKDKVCKISRKQFRDKAPAGLNVTINGQSYIAGKKEFDTKSLGWNTSEKGKVEIDGVLCDVQIGLNVTLLYSKNLPE